MNIRVVVLGWEILRIELTEDQDQTSGPLRRPSAADRGVKAISRTWVKRMVR